MSLRQTLLSIDWPTGYRKIIIDEVDSTMKEARRRQQYINQPTWILAKNQTKAHGRRGRVWSNPNGPTLFGPILECMYPITLRSK